jgi:hypothetical protein
LVPDPESTLFEEIAARHAEIVNRCGFDGLYLDAIDGSSILRGGDECWYWADRFVFEIQKRLQRPVGMEMSAMWHHFWQYRTRWQAWDYPQRGHQRFIDLHADAVNGGLLIPLHLGWLNFQSFHPPQIEPTYPEVIEYLGAKLIGWDAGISLTGAVDRDRLRTVPLVRRAVDILRTCEQLRLAGTVAPALKAQLREPGKAFALGTDTTGQPYFRRAHHPSHTVSLDEPWTRSWQVTNPFPEQPIQYRLEALMSTAPHDDPQAMVLAVRLESPAHLAYGAIADRYLAIDFRGRRRISLVETESTRWSDYVWNDGKSLYNVYRETIDFGVVESATLWCQNLPPGRGTRCQLGPVKALPLRPSTVKDPTLTVNGATIVLPVGLTSGGWIEWRGAEGGQHYGPKGEALGPVIPPGSPLTLRAGENRLAFAGTTTHGPAPRLKITVFCRGERL